MINTIADVYYNVFILITSISHFLFWFSYIDVEMKNKKKKFLACSTGRSLACSLLLRCSDYYDDYGVCIGGCQTGFSGLHCLEGELNYFFY